MNRFGLRIMRKRYMKYAFLFTANALHFSIMNKFYFYFFKRGVYGVFFRSAPENDLFIRKNGYNCGTYYNNQYLSFFN
jgi:hypothetical protein